MKIVLLRCRVSRIVGASSFLNQRKKHFPLPSKPNLDGDLSPDPHQVGHRASGAAILLFRAGIYDEQLPLPEKRIGSIGGQKLITQVLLLFALNFRSPIPPLPVKAQPRDASGT